MDFPDGETEASGGEAWQASPRVLIACYCTTSQLLPFCEIKASLHIPVACV